MLYQIISLLLEVAFGLVAGACLLRLYMQFQGINLSGRMNNPLAPFIFTFSNWIVLPLRRVLPALGRLDSASLVAAYGLVLLKLLLLSLLMGGPPNPLGLWVLAVFELIRFAISGLVWLVILHVVLSWVQAGSTVHYVFLQLVEPLLRPIRRILPLIGGIDLSPLALLLLLEILNILMAGLRHAFFMG